MAILLHASLDEAENREKPPKLILSFLMVGHFPNLDQSRITAFGRESARDVGPHCLCLALDQLYSRLHEVPDRDEPNHAAAVDDGKVPDPPARHQRKAGEDADGWLDR